MTLRPGFPERTQFDGIIKQLEARISALEKAKSLGFSSDGETTFLRNGRSLQIVDGAVIVSEDGDFQVQLADGTTLMVLDDGRLRFNRADGTRQLEVTPAGGMKFYEANGTTVITTLDKDGLQVIGGFVTPVWPIRAGDSDQNVSLTTSASDFLTVTIDPPDWVEELTLLSIGKLQMSNSSGGGQNILCGVTNDDGGASEQRVTGEAGTHSSNSPATNTVTVPNGETIPLSPAGRSVDVVLDGAVNTGTNSSNFLTLSVIGFGTRNP